MTLASVETVTFTRRRARLRKPSLSVTDLVTVRRLLRPDGHVLDELSARHCRVLEPLILDPTWGKGEIFKASRHHPQVRLDLAERRGQTHRASWLDMPTLFAPATFDLAVADPIFVPDVGANAAKNQQFTSADNPVTGQNVAPLIEQLLVALRPVMKPTGTVIFKLQDINHGGPTQFQTHDLRQIATGLGYFVEDYELSLAPALTNDPKWKRMHMSPKPWTFWYVLHLQPRCPGKGIVRPNNHRCVMCGQAYVGRADAQTCSDRCRARRWRAAQKALRQRSVE